MGSQPCPLAHPPIHPPTHPPTQPSSLLALLQIRYFIMHAIGGLYLDMDVECFRSAEPFLADAEVVLQVSHRGYIKMGGHGMVASSKQHCAGEAGGVPGCLVCRRVALLRCPPRPNSCECIEGCSMPGCLL